MKKLILLGIIVFFSGCSVRSYNKTIVYPNNNVKKESYQSIQPIYSNSNNCNCNDYYSINNDPFCDCSNGMYLQNELGW